MQRRFDNLPDINAEMLLEHLYPELCDKFVVKDKGMFLRGYSSDLISVDAETRQVSLSRDGFLKCLPQSLLGSEQELHSGEFSEKYRRLRRRVRILSDAFAPVDAYIFRQRLQVERQVSQLLDDKIDFILRHYFGIDRRKLSNEYVVEMAALLPFVSRLRGDMAFVRSTVESVTGCTTELVTGRYSMKGNTRKWLPLVRFNVLVPNLSHEQYTEFSQKLRPLEEFLREWFVPAEAHCVLEVRQHGAPQELGESLMLDYNVEPA